MARGKAHTDEKKAKVVAALMAGGAVAQVAREFGLPESTVRTWGEAGGVDFAEVRAEKKEALLDQIAGYLQDNLSALRVQCRVASEPSFLRKHSCQDLAILHGVMADKAMRIIEAYASAQPLE
jgi:transposase-like protein